MANTCLLFLPDDRPGFPGGKLISEVLERNLKVEEKK